MIIYRKSSADIPELFDRIWIEGYGYQFYSVNNGRATFIVKGAKNSNDKLSIIDAANISREIISKKKIIYGSIKIILYKFILY
jgi:hypothetical protein